MNESIDSSCDECIPSPEATKLLQEAKELSTDAYVIVARAKDLGERASSMSKKNCLFTLKNEKDQSRLFLCKEINLDEAKSSESECTSKDLRTNESKNLQENDTVEPLSIDESKEESKMSDDVVFEINVESGIKSEAEVPDSKNKAELFRQASESSKELDIALKSAEGMAIRTADLADNLKEFIAFSETLKASSEIVNTTKDILDSTMNITSMIQEKNNEQTKTLGMPQNIKTKESQFAERKNSVETVQSEIMHGKLTSYKPTNIISNAATHASLLASAFKNKINHLQQSKRATFFFFGGLSLGCFIGYLIGMLHGKQVISAEANETMEKNDENTERLYYTGKR